MCFLISPGTITLNYMQFIQMCFFSFFIIFIRIENIWYPLNWRKSGQLNHQCHPRSAGRINRYRFYLGLLLWCHFFIATPQLCSFVYSLQWWRYLDYKLLQSSFKNSGWIYFDNLMTDWFGQRCNLNLHYWEFQTFISRTWVR